MGRNFLKIEGENLTLAHTQAKYLKLLEDAMMSEDAIVKANLAKMAQMAGGNGNIIISTGIDLGNQKTLCGTLHNENGTVKMHDFSVNVFSRTFFVACTMDGRNFTDEEERKLSLIGEKHLRSMALGMGALYVRVYNADGKLTRTVHLQKPAAETC